MSKDHAERALKNWTDPRTNINRVNGMKGGGQKNELAQKFRLAIRETMNLEDVKKEVKNRVLAELQGTMDVKITPTCMKIAAGQYYQSENRSNQLQAPTGTHFYMVGWSDRELSEFSDLGLVPDHARLMETKATKG